MNIAACSKLHLAACFRPSLSIVGSCFSRQPLAGHFAQALRRYGTRAPITSKPKFLYPQRLLVYHAGTGRTVFIGCTKVSTLFVFAFASLVLAPSYYYAPDEPEWMIPLVIAGGAIPLLYVARSTKPFVTYVHLVLPNHARMSREALMKWLNQAGRDVDVDMTTMRFIGLARIMRMRLSELRTRKEDGGDISNLVRASASAANTSLARRLFGLPTRFHVGTTVNHAPEPKLWQALLQRIPKQSLGNK